MAKIVVARRGVSGVPRRPKVEALAQAVVEVGPAAVLTGTCIEGRGMSARAASRTPFPV